MKSLHIDDIRRLSEFSFMYHAGVKRHHLQVRMRHKPEILLNALLYCFSYSDDAGKMLIRLP